MDIMSTLQSLAQIDFASAPSTKMVQYLQEFFRENGLSEEAIQSYSLTIVSQKKVIMQMPPDDWNEITSSAEFKEMSRLYGQIILNTRKGWIDVGVSEPDAYVLANFPELKFS